MDYNTSHDIIHEKFGNQSESCPVCKGDMKGDDVQKEAGKIIQQQRAQRSNMHLWGGELDAKKENALDDSDFAYIDKKGVRKLPIHDAAHVRNALARFNQTQFDSPEDKTKAKAKIDSRAKELGVKVSADEDSSYKPSYSPLTIHQKSVYPLSEIKAGENGSLPAEIQIMPIGKWDTVPYGELSITASDLEEMKTNFEKGYRAGVPIDVDHDGKAAAGWIESLRVGDDGLWARVTWTDLGKKLLGERQYRFFSPEFNPEYTDPEDKSTTLNNVLIAGSLVNRPLFKELAPIVASDHLTRKGAGVMLFTESMNIEKLLAKKKAGETLTASEKAFLASYIFDDENSGDRKGPADSKGNVFVKSDKAKPGDKAKAMGEGHSADDNCKECEGCGDKMHDASAHTDHQDDGDGDNDQDEKGKEKKGSEKGKGVTISAAEYEALKSNADRGVEAAEKLEAKEIDETVSAWMFNETGGRFAPAVKDDLIAFYTGLSAKQRKTFSELVEKMPEQKYLFDERGSAEDLTKGGAADTLTIRAKELMESAKKENRRLTFSQAVKQATRENPALGEYDLIAVKGKVVAKQ